MMETTSTTASPLRITDIVAARSAGATVTLKTHFEVLPVDFQHSAIAFQAYIFLVHYHGSIDGKPFEFRKCYARGCPHNLCTHVSLAVTIANRYLQRDYHALKSAGIPIEEKLFTLDDMVIKFEQLQQGGPSVLTLDDLVGLARAGTPITVEHHLAYLPAVEHFGGRKNAQTFLSGEFFARADRNEYTCHRCFSCYAVEQEKEAKTRAITVANARLEMVYQSFDQAGITYTRQYFQ